MNLIETEIEGLLIIEPRVFGDNRGYFFESYSKKKFEDTGIRMNFVQDNQSRSTYGVIRALHYQLEPKAQTKLVRVIEGTVYDVAVDIRKDSPTFGKWAGVELSADNKKQFLIPKGFAHGFSVLSDNATVLYKCDEFYHPEMERGIIYNDNTLDIDWKIDPGKVLVSERDQSHPAFRDAEMNF